MPVTINGTTGIAGPDGSASTPAVQGTDSNTGLFFPAADTVAITTGGTQRVTVDSSGNLGLGVTPSAWRSVWRALQFGNSGALFARTDASYSVNVGGNFFNNTSNQDTYINSSFATNYQQSSGEHRWFTAPSGTANTAITSFTQAMTLDASGRLVIGGTTATSDAGITIANDSNGSATVKLSFSTTTTERCSISMSGGGGEMRLTSGYTGYGGFMTFYANGSERARITSAGDFRVKGAGTAGSTDAFQVSGSAPADAARITSAGDLLVGKTSESQASLGWQVRVSDWATANALSSSSNAITTSHIYSTGAGAYRFYVGMGGTIYATSTTITAISDQRLKENIQDIDVGLNAVMALKPRKFDWKEGKGKDKKGDRGWIAQEFEQVFPDMITTWKDEPPEGEEPYKAVNADLIPVLVKAIQEQQALITSLTARVAALEGTQP